MVNWIAKDTDGQMLEIKTNGACLVVDSKMSSKRIELTIDQYHESITMMLDDEAIKALIEHLQRQVQ